MEVIGVNRPTSPPPLPPRPRTPSITTARLIRAVSTHIWLPHTCLANPISIPTQPLLLWAPPALWPTWWHHKDQHVMRFSMEAIHQASSIRSQSAWAIVCCHHPPCITVSTRPSLPTRPTSAPRLPPPSTLDTRWAPPKSTSTLTSREDTDWHWRAWPSAAASPQNRPTLNSINIPNLLSWTSDINRDRGTCNPHATVTYNLKILMTERKRKQIHNLSRRERWGWISEGYSSLCLFYFLKGPVFSFICLFFTLLYEESNVSLFYRDGWKRPFGTMEVFLFAFLLLSPLKFGNWLLNRGYWLEVWNPKRIGRRWNTETCCSSKKKISMALNCLNISKSFMVWGEKRGNSPHSTFSSRGGFWKYNQQKTTNFVVYL